MSMKFNKMVMFKIELDCGFYYKNAKNGQYF